MRRIGVLYGGNAHQHRTFRESKYNLYSRNIITMIQ